jgi:hypothetical protein
MTDDTIAALERLQAWLDADDASHFGQHEKDLQTILDHIERGKEPPIVRIDPAQYEDGLYLNPITGAVMWIAIFPPV